MKLNIAGVELETGQEKIVPYNEHTKEYINAMKPSERIKEIYDSFEEDKHIGVKHHFAIIQYLDEQYEQNKPCQHKNIEDFKGLDSCKDCGVVGWLKD